MTRTSTLQSILKEPHRRIQLLFMFMALFFLFHISVMPFQLSYYSSDDFIKVNIAYNLIALFSMYIGLIAMPKYLPYIFTKVLGTVFNRIAYIILLLFSIGIGIFIFKIVFGYYDFVLARVGTGIFAMIAFCVPIGLVAYAVDTKMDRTSIKEWSELAYWKIQKLKTPQLNNDHYEEFYTHTFDMRRSDYNGKSVLDIGCGPRGSLEWVPDTTVAIGLDPLAKEYIDLQVSSNKLKMKLVEGYCENIPFEDNYFDIVTSFNSLDHVENLRLSTHEIQRVLKPGGLLLLICDVNRKATITEPHTITPQLLIDLFVELELKHKRLLTADHKFRIYENVRSNTLLHDLSEQGVLIAKFSKWEC